MLMFIIQLPSSLSLNIYYYEDMCCGLILQHVKILRLSVLQPIVQCFRRRLELIEVEPLYGYFLIPGRKY
jgi:hypothetical protein